MKFTITQANLSRGLSLTEKIVPRNTTLPILQNVLVRCEKNTGQVKLSSTNLEIGVEVTVPAKVEEEGSTTIPIRLFLALASNLPDEKVEISEKNNEVTVRCKNYKANIRGQGSGEFPLIPGIEVTDALRIKTHDLCSAISSVAHSVSPLDVKPELTGVYAYFKKDEACFVATDSFRLSEKRAPIETKNQYENKLIIPKATSDAIVRIFEGSDETLGIEATKNQIFIKNAPGDSLAPSIRMVSRVIDGDYPNYEQVIPESFSTTVEVPREGLISHIRGAALFSSKVNEVKIDANPAAQQLEVYSKDQEQGSYHSTIPCVIQGGAVGFVFNYGYLLEGLQSILSETIVIKCNEATNPVLIVPFEGGGFRYVIMPIKT